MQGELIVPSNKTAVIGFPCVFRTHLLRERYRVRREIFPLRGICKKKIGRKFIVKEINDYVLVDL